MRARHLTDRQATAAAHGLGIHRWGSRAELDALLDAWPMPPSREDIEAAATRLLVDDLRREEARCVRLLVEVLKRQGRRHLEVA